jgi:hypothetical protein
MAKTTWSGYLQYRAIDLEMNGMTIKKVTELSSPGVSVAHFSVHGGADRILDLTTTDDISLTSEFEQARTYQNLRLFLMPGKGFAFSDMMDIAFSHLPVTINFYVGGQIGKTLTQTLSIRSENAKILGKPDRREDSKGNRFLVVRFEIPNSRLIHGVWRGNGLDETEM